MVLTKDLIYERNNLIEQARALNKRAEDRPAGERELKPDEKEQYDRIVAAMEEVQSRLERQEQQDKWASFQTARAEAPAPRIQIMEGNNARQILKAGNAKRFDTPEYREAFRNYLRRGITNSALAFDADTTEDRALSLTVAAGGYTVDSPLHKAIFGIAAQGMSFYDLATHINAEQSTIDIPTVATSGTAANIAEATALTTSVDPSFGLNTLTLKKAHYTVTLSNELLEDSLFDLESWIAQHAGNAIGERNELGFVSGTGSAPQPTGFLGTATTPITTSAAFSYTNLVNLYYAVRAGWRNKGTWLCNASSMGAILLLKDSNNNFLFVPSQQQGSPGFMLGRPVRESFAMGNDAVGQKPIAFGDFSNYVIFERPLSAARSDHVSFNSDQVVLRFTYRRDGKLQQADAVQTILRGS